MTISTEERTGAQVKNAPSQVFAGGELPELDKPYQTKWYDKVRRMRRDPTIALARWMSVAPTLAAGWSVEATEHAPAGARDFIETEMAPHRLGLLRSVLYGQVDFGWAPFEKVLRLRRNGLIGVHKMKPLLQDFTDILVDPTDGSYAGLRNEVPGSPEPIDLTVSDSLLVSLDVEGTDWYGQAIARNAERAYDDWNAIADSATRYDKRVSGTHWVVYYPLGKSRFNGQDDVDNYEIACSILASLESSGRLVIPRAVQNIVDELAMSQATNVEALQWKLDLLTDSGAGSTSYESRQKYMDVLKVRAFGLPERAVLEGTFGTKAEAQTHVDIALTNMDLRYQTTVEELNRHLIDQLLRVNYGEQFEGTVYLVASPIADLQLELFRKIYLALLSNPAGFDNELLAVDIGALRDKLGIPVSERGEDLVDPVENAGLLAQEGVTV